MQNKNIRDHPPLSDLRQTNYNQSAASPALRKIQFAVCHRKSSAHTCTAPHRNALARRRCTRGLDSLSEKTQRILGRVCTSRLRGYSGEFGRLIADRYTGRGKQINTAEGQVHKYRRQRKAGRRNWVWSAERRIRREKQLAATN